MKKSLNILTIMLAVAAMVGLMSMPAMAKVTGVCGNCHTMHNSQGGTNMMINTTIDGTSGGTHGGGYPALTRGSCVGCHTGDPDAGSTPYVSSTSSPDGGYLAGGNFWYVTQDSANGHNVKGVPGIVADSTLTEAPGNQHSCGPSSCHATLFAPDATIIGGGALDTGCQGCHLEPKHHAPQQTAGAPALEANGYFRFLSSHISSTNGVHGIEDDDWEFDATASNHNEYLGSTTSANNTMTGYCVGCHGDFHTQEASGNWIRHPSDAVLPSTGEYTGYTTYNPIVPVARPDLGAIAATELVANNSDMVMCLSCHRAHGTPYGDLLRWNYGEMLAGDNTKSGGCFVCHTAKND